MELFCVILRWCLHDPDIYLDPQKAQPTPTAKPDINRGHHLMMGQSWLISGKK